MWKIWFNIHCELVLSFSLFPLFDPIWGYDSRIRLKFAKYVHVWPLEKLNFFFYLGLQRAVLFLVVKFYETINSEPSQSSVNFMLNTPLNFCAQFDELHFSYTWLSFKVFKLFNDYMTSVWNKLVSWILKALNIKFLLQKFLWKSWLMMKIFLLPLLSIFRR